MLQSKLILKRLIYSAFALVLNACAPAENDHTTPAKHSAMAVKNSSKSISFNPLNTQDIAQVIHVEQAFSAHKNGVFIEDSAEVIKLLADDKKGPRHQRFLVKVATGTTLLIAHNIDLAPRVNNLQIGDQVSFRGEYIYNQKGGLLHWTHQDPQHEKVGGWIEHNNHRYH